MKIGICGTHCAGKTTLVNALKNEFGYEKFRYICEIAATIPRIERETLAVQAKILSAQIAAEQLAKPDFISDRTVLDNLAYTFYYAYVIENDLRAYTAAFNEVEKYFTTKPYDIIFFIDEYFPLVDNGIRNHVDEEFQDTIFNILKDWCSSKLWSVPIIKLRGTTDKRIEQIKRAIDLYGTE